MNLILHDFYLVVDAKGFPFVEVFFKTYPFSLIFSAKLIYLLRWFPSSSLGTDILESPASILFLTFH